MATKLRTYKRKQSALRYKGCVVHCTTFGKDEEKQTIVGFNQNSSQIEAPRATQIDFNPLSRKGILKTRPQGCIGLCNCLSCSSFHLHVSRAFEFSRNQMQEAEDVAFGLIRELITLRKLVEESDVTQAKACRKALETEELAMKRLTLMKEDLFVHCRSPNPRITFANNVEEKVIPKVDYPRRSSRIRLRETKQQKESVECEHVLANI